MPTSSPMGRRRGLLNGSIRNRILVPYLALIVALVGGTGLATARWAAERARQRYLERGRGIAETLQRSHFPLTEAVLLQLKGLGGAEFALLGDDGRLGLSTLGDLAGGRILAGPARAEDEAAGSDLGFQRVWRHGGVAYRFAVVDRGTSAGPADARRLLILLPEPALRAAAWEARRAVLSFTLVGAALAALLASWIGQSLSRPLSAILEATRQIGRGELRPRGLPRGRVDEIGELAEGIAQMAAWLERFQDERVQTERLHLIRQVSAGLAHELRNPLTAARMTVQLYVERNRDRDAEPLRIALEELTRVERQVRRFLQIARPDPPRFEVTDVGPILARVVASLAASAEHRGIALRVEADADLPPARVDPEQIAQVLANLTSNALDAAGPGGQVRLLAKRSPAGLTIEVEDDGPGVSAGDEPRLFQPFFTTKPEGVGLGLALCDALVREHGGTIRYLRRDGRACFRVDLPVALSGRPVDVGRGPVATPVVHPSYLPSHAS